jgi:hypothetical protein
VSTLEDNKGFTRRYTREVFDEGNVAAVDEYLPPDFLNVIELIVAEDDLGMVC